MIGQEQKVFGDWFILHFVENPGMAFGLEFAGKAGKYILSIFRIAAVSLIAFYILRVIRKNLPVGYLISVCLVFAGATGNIIDSLFYVV